jgi:DNA sulfur modification protein DndD
VEDDLILVLIVVRYWDKNPKDGKDTLGVLEGDWPRTDLRDTWDEYIENLLPLGISNLFLFDGEQVKELAEQETPPPVVVEAIQSLLGLELAERLSIDLDILVSRKRKKLANEAERQSLEEIEERLSRYQEEYEAAKQDLAALQGKVEYAEKNQRKAWDKFVSEGGKIASERTQLEKQKRALQEQRDGLREELRELAAGVLPLVMIQPLLAEALLQGEKEAKHQQAKISRDVVKERSDRLLGYLAEINLTPEQIDKIQFFLEQEDKDLSSHLAAEEDLWLSADEDTLSIIANLLRHHLGDRVKYTLAKLQKLKTIEQEITFTERQLAAAASPEIYQQLEQAVRDTEAALVDAKTNYETGRRRHDELERNIKGVKKELAEYSAVNIDRQNDEHIIQSANKVQETLKVFRERLTLRKLNKLESEVTECFLYLLHKSDLVNRVVIDTHSFSLSLFDMEGKSVPKHRLSAGEKQLLAIAFLWGLARVSGRHLPVAIDTPLGRLDSSHRHNLVERYFPSASHQVILLSTDTEIGKVEVENLREHEALSHEYLLKYKADTHQTVVENGYFW